MKLGFDSFDVELPDDLFQIIGLVNEEQPKSLEDEWKKESRSWNKILLIVEGNCRKREFVFFGFFFFEFFFFLGLISSFGVFCHREKRGKLKNKPPKGKRNKENNLSR